MIHKEVLCYLSELFADGFKVDGEEAKTGIVSMEDVDPDIFGILVHYIHPTNSGRSREG